MKDFSQYRDPALRALLRCAADVLRTSEKAHARKVETHRAASAADLRGPDGPKLRRTASLADVLGSRRRA